MSIGTKIRVIRELRQYKQEYVAERLGISQNAYSRLESGETKLTLDRLQKIAEILDRPIEDFLNDQNVTINMQNKHGANGYNIVFNEHSMAEMLKQIFSMMTQLLQEQQRHNERLIEYMDRNKP